MIVENAAGAAAFDVEHDQAGAACVGDIGRAAVETDVVDVAAGLGDLRPKRIDARDGVSREIDPHHFGASRQRIAAEGRRRYRSPTGRLCRRGEWR